MTKIVCGAGVIQSPAEIRNSTLFTNWLNKFGPDWQVEEVAVKDALAWKGDVRMLLVRVTAIDPEGKRRNSAALLRGSTVEILPIILAPDGTEFVVLVEQSRVPAAQRCVTTPAGMVDDGDIMSTALQEIREEVGGNISWSKPRWLNKFATGSDQAMLVTPGGSDEDVQFCTITAVLTEEQMRSLHGSRAGAAMEGESTAVHVVLLLTEALPYLASGGRQPCMKTVLSLLLYQLARQYRL